MSRLVADRVLACLIRCHEHRLGVFVARLILQQIGILCAEWQWQPLFDGVKKDEVAQRMAFQRTG